MRLVPNSKRNSKPFLSNQDPLRKEVHSLGGLLWSLAALFLFAALASSEETGNAASTGAVAEAPAAELNFPGLKINREERSVDIKSTVCLEAGFLELVACTQGTKEHEAIVAIETKAIHVHTALLLLKAQAGSPAMSKPVDASRTEWIDVPPSGSEVRVSLLIPDENGKTVERPIRDFVEFSAEEYSGPPPFGKGAPDKEGRLPTSTFLFAGSILSEEKAGQPRRYLAEQSGNVITLSTFGDEMLCLPEIHSHQNGALMWAVNPTHLPPPGTKVILRLRPEAPKDEEAQ